MRILTSPVHISLPAGALQPYISHYWLSLENREASYPITPDGAVDVIVVMGASAVRLDAFGTTTKRSAIQLEIGSHYLGVRFKPGQSRHFLDIKTCELTNAVYAAEGAFLPDVSAVAESITTGSAFRYLDAALLRHLQRQPPRHARIDEVIRHIETTAGRLQVAELANLYCKSRRQFERTFLEVAGLSAKQFSAVIRFRRAATLLAHSRLSLAQIAASLGYTDQSHFTHEFARFFGQAPSRAREDAAFLQDVAAVSADNGEPFY